MQAVFIASYILHGLKHCFSHFFLSSNYDMSPEVNFSLDNFDLGTIINFILMMCSFHKRRPGSPCKTTGGRAIKLWPTPCSMIYILVLNNLQHAVPLAQEEEASNWLSSLPIQENGCVLHKGALRDDLALHHAWLATIRGSV